MKTFLLSLIAAGYLYGAAEESHTVLSDVAKLRQKYEECRQNQAQDTNPKIKGYQTRISHLEAQIKDNVAEIKRLTTRTKEIEQELSRKKGVIQSLEKTLTSRDEQFRAAVSRNEQLSKEANAIKVGKIERENLTKALAKAKEEAARLQNDLKKSSPAGLRKDLDEARMQITQLRKELAAAQPLRSKTTVAAGESEKVKALQRELDKAHTAISQLQNTPQPVKEKVVTKVVEPTEKLATLQRELNAARAEIANLKHGAPKQIVKEKIVEKVVYKDRPVEKGAPKVVEKVVYKDRPVIQEKIVTKTVESAEKIKALQTKLAQAEAQVAKLKTAAPAAHPKRTVIAAAAVRNTPSQIKAPSVQPAKKAAAPSPAPKKSGSSAYRMASNASIYNAPGGAPVDTWEARRSFTAGEPSGGWVHITGYFVNRVWQPTREDEHLWVRESDVIRR
jgi:peptidoglycan hydrolase CwlO-like protein